MLRCFKMTSLFFPQVKPVFFTETGAPDWLTGVGSVPGSTMDHRWFWRDHVMTLPIGECVDTDFQRIERIAPYARVYRDGFERFEERLVTTVAKAYDIDLYTLRQRQRQLCGSNSKFAVLHLGEFLRD